MSPSGESPLQLLASLQSFGFHFNCKQITFHVLPSTHLLSFRTLRTDSLEIPTALANFLVEFFLVRGFRMIRSKIFFLLVGVQAVLGRPLPSRSSLVLVSLKRLRARETVECGTCKSTDMA